MPYSADSLDIELSDTELDYFNAIHFDWKSHDDLRASLKPMYELTCSLLERKAIPEARLRYFTEPEFNPGGRGKSREQVFEKNGTSGDAILNHPHFLKHLEYFLFGPKLPPSIVRKFREAVELADHLSGHDVYDLIPEAKSTVQARKLDPKDASEEFYKLAIECGAMPSSANSLRTSVRAMKVNH